MTLFSWARARVARRLGGSCNDMILVPSVPSPVPTVPTVSHPRLSPLTPLLPPSAESPLSGDPRLCPQSSPQSPQFPCFCGFLWGHLLFSLRSPRRSPPCESSPSVVGATREVPARGTG